MYQSNMNNLMKIIIFMLSIVQSMSIEIDNETNLKLPTGFSLGVATSAYQIEGAWNVGDKGESVWDRFVHENPQKIVNQSTGDVACDSYHKFKEDVKLLKEMGLNHYRFSLSWPRILPTGYSHIISRAGLKYYHDLLDELEKNQITAFVTIYHWDTPEPLQQLGGWTNELLVELFGEYARLVFREFGDRVKFFTTINEPHAVCQDGYSTGSQAPGYRLGNTGDYLCGHNILKAHARAYHIYDEEFRAKQGGRVGIAIPCQYYFVKSAEELDAQERAFQFNCGRFAHPIFSDEGDYPEVVKRRVAEKSQLEGRARSKLPAFSEYWIRYIKGTADYYGLNHYTSAIVESAPPSNETKVENDADLVFSIDPKWPNATSSWLKVVPEGLRNVLIQIKERYNNPPVYILENGFSDNGTLADTGRVNFLFGYMQQMLIAIEHDKCDVRAYTIWSLLDNFEWDRGYSERFGLTHVNFNDDNRTRTPKLSAKWLKNVARTRELNSESLVLSSS